MRFHDRQDAGRQLGALLQRYRDENPVVLALPRGGVAVGYEVARVLGAPLDVLVARKIGAPGQPELGIGAVAPGGVRVVDERAVHWLGVSEAELESIAAAETAEMERREARYRDGRPPVDLSGRTAILVDDGLATGVTARAAIAAVRRRGPRRLVLAVPVCAWETTGRIRPLVDELVCAHTPDDFRAVGLWYADFGQLADEDVTRLLERADSERRTQNAAAGPPQPPTGG